MLSRVADDSPNWMPTNFHLAGIVEATSFIRFFRLHADDETFPAPMRNMVNITAYCTGESIVTFYCGD